jgi:uncharacterized membrane protein
MNWYNVIKFLHILAVTITIGGMFARQLVRGLAKKSGDLQAVASLTQAAARIDRGMVIPWSSAMLPFGVILAVLQKWPIFGFLQGASANWLLVSNLMLIVMLALIPAVFVPHNKKVESILQSALAQGRITPELSAALDDQQDKWGHYAEEIIILIITMLMVLKPF